LLEAGAIPPLVALVQRTPEDFAWNSECDSCFAEPLEGRRFKLGKEEGDLCQACMEQFQEEKEAKAEAKEPDGTETEDDSSILELPRDIAGECLIALMAHDQARALMVERGAAGFMAHLLMEGTVFGKLLALEGLRALVVDQELSEMVLEEAGLGPIAVALGVAPAQVVVEEELRRQWEGDAAAD